MPIDPLDQRGSNVVTSPPTCHPPTRSLTKTKLQVYNNGRHGIMLHRSCDYAIVRNNNVTNNGLGGVAVFETFHADIKYNNLVDNYRK